METSVTAGMVIELIVIVGKIILKILSMKNPFKDENEEMDNERIKRFIDIGKRIVIKNSDIIAKEEAAYRALLDWDNLTRYFDYGGNIFSLTKMQGMGIGTLITRHEQEVVNILADTEKSNIDKSVLIAKVLI